MTDDRGQIGFVLRVFPSVCPLSSVVCPLVGEVGLEPTKAKPADLQFHFGRFSKSLEANAKRLFRLISPCPTTTFPTYTLTSPDIGCT